MVEKVSQIELELAQISPQTDTLVTVGVFDGVHLGHKYLISRLREQAREKNLTSGVITFRQHPQEILTGKDLPHLTTLEQRISLLKEEGIDFVAALTFNQEVARLGANKFINLMKQYLRIRGLVVGPDFALGHQRKGDSQNLSLLGKGGDFTVTVVPPIKTNGEVVSSTAIREALINDNLAKVHFLLGRYFSIQALVTSGVGRGGKLGFPTANLDLDPIQALPTDGVYATWVHLDDQKYQSVTNIGKRPTFDNGERTVEVFLLDYHDNLYGRQLTVDFIEKLRDEQKFSSADKLVKQMKEDVKQSRAILFSRVANP
jgi:riboflavin kinase/FMN adenylyltransferase